MGPTVNTLFNLSLGWPPLAINVKLLMEIHDTICTLRQENIGPVNKSSAVFAKYLSNHLGYREVIYLIGKP